VYKVSTEDYLNKTVTEFEKLNHLPDHSEVCLWFENDLFCQANMWFVISILANQPTLKIFRIFPVIENKADLWKGFGVATMLKCSNRLMLQKFSLHPMTLNWGKVYGQLSKMAT
jgi:hypothetical protein